MIKKIIAITILCLATYASIKTQLPADDFIEKPDKSQFSNKRAYKHVQELGDVIHYSGSEHHQQKLDYIVEELQKMGLETQIQEGNTFSDWGSFVKAKNVIARIKGTDNGKALTLMTHYDSSPHSSFGASDAGSGVATILEGVRAFLRSKTSHKNDIIILITDAEELGLNGAQLFVKEHPWINDIGLILNFEARGSGGPSFTLLETNEGNSALIDEFIKANPRFPVANSLAYSIYKKLPNDTDLTVFRKEANIQGFNFAFIDDHYDYHTALDVPERLDNNTLSHQASYLMPLLTHFSNTDLNSLTAEENYVYFNTPLGMHSYPFSWIKPLVLIAVVLFIVILFYGKRQKKLRLKEIGKGFLAFIIVLVVNALLGVFGWKTILNMYPHYNEILQGFTYNGHWYILFFVLLSLTIIFFVYKKVYEGNNTKELMVAPLFFWLLINTVIAFELEGASFYIIPVYFALGLFYFLIRKDKPSMIALTLLSLPAVIIYAPFIEQFPIALGLKAVVASCALVTLLFGLLLPVFGFIRRKKMLGYITFFVTVITFGIAHMKNEFSKERPKPNSLVYMQNEDDHKSYWLTYDEQLDDWTSTYFSETADDTIGLLLDSKYETPFKKVSPAKHINIEESEINITLDTVIGDMRNVKVCVTPKRIVNSIKVRSSTKMMFANFSINGKKVDTKKESRFFKKGDLKIATYHVVNKESMEVRFRVHKDSMPHLELLEVSHDLLKHPVLNVSERGEDMIPKPFVINDAIIVKSTLKF